MFVPSRSHSPARHVISLAPVFAALIMTSSVFAQKPLKVFLLLGQSNAVGYLPGGISQLPTELQGPQYNVKLAWWENPWGPLRPSTNNKINCCDYASEITFGHDLAAALPNDSIGIYKAGEASDISGWQSPSGTQWAHVTSVLQGQLDTAVKLGYTPTVAGLLWMQGESDAGNGGYASQFKSFLDALKTLVKNPNLPVVIGMVDSVPAWGYAGTVRAQERVIYNTIPYVALTDTRGFPHYDDGHFNGRGQMQLGSSFAAQMGRLLKCPLLGTFIEPSDLVAKALRNGQVQLTWRDNSSAETGYSIERKTGSGAYAQIAAIGAVGTLIASYTDATAAANTDYTYRVKATDATTSAAYSNEAEIFPLGAGNGLKAEYFASQTATTAALSRVDTVINFNWNGSAPGAGLGSGFFVRWSGYVQPRYSETYTFFINSDAVGRIWVNNQQICNQWSTDPQETGSDPAPIHYGAIELTAGQAVPIKVEYYAMNYSQAHAQLCWRTFVSQDYQVVPKSMLYQDSPTGLFHDRQALLSDARGISLTSRGASVKITGLSGDGTSTVTISDLRGRAVLTALVRNGASVEMPACGSGAYVVTVKDCRSSAMTSVMIRR